MLPSVENFILVMGVSGSGKSTFSKQLAEAISAEFIDADDHHSEQAKEQMSRGVPLTDEQRLPWIKRLCERVKEGYRLNQPLVMACSLLRTEHRAMFYRMNLPLTLIYLHGEQPLIKQRLEQRQGHFFSLSLLQDQFAMLQPPDDSEHPLRLDIRLEVEELVVEALQYLQGLKQ